MDTKIWTLRASVTVAIITEKAIVKAATTPKRTSIRPMWYKTTAAVMGNTVAMMVARTLANLRS